MLAFAGLATVAVAGAVDATPPREQLPNLVPLRPVTLMVGGPTTYVTGEEGGPVFACQPSEAADTPVPQRCLRFETHAANVGSGPLELRFRVDSYATTRSVVQRVYRADGTYRDSAAGTYVFHPAHAHFHYDDFAVAALWRSDAKGRRLDRNPVRQGSKIGFCVADEYAWKPGAPPAKYQTPGACYPNTVTQQGEASQVSGISPGWVDAYDVSVPHQYIEISGVPDGYYLLQMTIDPLHRLRESTTKDNVTWQRIRLCGDRVDIVGRTALCGR